MSLLRWWAQYAPAVAALAIVTAAMHEPTTAAIVVGVLVGVLVAIDRGFALALTDSISGTGGAD